MRGRKPELATDRNALDAVISAPWLACYLRAHRTVKLNCLSCSDNSPLAVTLFDVIPINTRMVPTHFRYGFGVAINRIVRQHGIDYPIKIMAISRFNLAQNNSATDRKLSLLYKIVKEFLSGFHFFLPIEAVQ